MSKHVLSTGIGRTLGKAFLLQAGFISLVAILGIWVSAYILEEVLIKKALQDEADYFWSKYKDDPSFSLPDTLNLTGFLKSTGIDLAPEGFGEYDQGFHNLDREDYSVLYVSEQDGEILYLLFDGKNVGNLALVFGLVPLAGVLILIYLAAWVSYRYSQKAISPIIGLANAVQNLDPQHPDYEVFHSTEFTRDVDHEVATLAQALQRFSQRIDAFVDRERNFTRDASHELRSPLTVIKIATDKLLSEHQLTKPAHAAVVKIQRSAKDMEELVEAFLVLARESQKELSNDTIKLKELVEEEAQRARELLFNKDIQIDINHQADLVLRTSEKALSVVLNNLIRNALLYTDEGRVTIVIGENFVCVRDSGIGIPKQALSEVFRPFHRLHSHRSGGHGVGLAIVKSLCNRFGWSVDICSEPNRGTEVSLGFPEEIIV